VGFKDDSEALVSVELDAEKNSGVVERVREVCEEFEG
jgi:hypothetical protein